jgi:IS30 family transposase
MNYLRDLIYRLRTGESERRISRELRISRITVHRYNELPEQRGFLKPGSPMAEDSAIPSAMGEAPQPPRTALTVEPHAEVVEQLLNQQVEMVAIFQRLRDEHGFNGSSSSVRRYVHQSSRESWCGCTPDRVRRLRWTSARWGSYVTRPRIACVPPMRLLRP